MQWYETRYVVCEVKAQHCANDGDIILSGHPHGYKSKELAAAAAEKYGYVGDNYIIKPTVIEFNTSRRK